MSTVQEVMAKLETIEKKLDEKKKIDDSDVWLKFMGVYILKGTPSQAAVMADECLELYRKRKT